MKTLPNPLYYLDNFHQVLDCIISRYRDLLTEREIDWIVAFTELPQASRALLIRFVMRKGSLFKSSKLSYEEIGCVKTAARLLVSAGWVDDQPQLDSADIHALLNKQEISGLLTSYKPAAGSKKVDLLEPLRHQYPEPMTFSEWQPESRDQIYRLSSDVVLLCDRLRLMFFGNLHQDWTEFVLAELGVFRYEKVAIDTQSRGFRSRDDVDAYLHLHACRQRFYAGEPADVVLSELGSPTAGNDWIVRKRAKFLFQIAQQYEKSDEFGRALELYLECNYPGSRLRAIRVQEKLGNTAAALELAQLAERSFESDSENQHLARIVPRLRRKLGMPKQARPALAPIDEWTLILPYPQMEITVEEVVRRYRSQEHAPAFYVENCLINSLFGLLCWDAVFYPIAGAFFHPFHTGPADLHSVDFYHRRKEQFAACFYQLESDAYKDTIRARFFEKSGIQSPFVFWEALDEALLELALECIPSAHLTLWFERLLQDIRANRNGFPDLIQFWPQEKRYRMIEVKGPGDRLQDNQVRLLAFAHVHNIPTGVCYVQWAELPA